MNHTGCTKSSVHGKAHPRPNFADRSMPNTPYLKKGQVGNIIESSQGTFIDSESVPPEVNGVHNCSRRSTCRSRFRGGWLSTLACESIGRARKESVTGRRSLCNRPAFLCSQAPHALKESLHIPMTMLLGRILHHHATVASSDHQYRKRSTSDITNPRWS